MSEGRPFKFPAEGRITTLKDGVGGSSRLGFRLPCFLAGVYSPLGFQLNKGTVSRGRPVRGLGCHVSESDNLFFE